MSDMWGNAAEVIRDLAERAAGPIELHPGIWGSINTAGDVNVTDLSNKIELLGEHPRRKRGHAHASDADSFAEYVNKHGTEGTEVWWNTNGGGWMVAVLNAPTEGSPGWSDHQVTLKLGVSSAWSAWAELDRKFLEQNSFAEHVEERLPDFVTPTGIEMLEIAQSMKASSTGEFESTQRLKSGETTLIFREKHSATAGAKGQLTVPDEFTLQLQPYEGGPAYKVQARFRYRISHGGLLLGYVLTRPEDIVRDAFMDVVKAVADAIPYPVWNGAPA